MEKEQKIEVFFDGDCPLCVREMKWIDRLDKKNTIKKTDISLPNFNAASYGKTQEAFMAKIHGRLPDGTWLIGVDVFREIYQSLGFKNLVAFSKLPGIRHFLHLSYTVFAKNRLRITGRCNSGTCKTSACKTSVET